MNNPRDVRSKRRARRLWIGYWLLLFVLTHVPISGVGTPRLRHADKAVHFVLFFGLAWLGAWAVARRRGGSVVISRVVAWAFVYLAYAAADEWLQSFVRRTPSVMDWLADAGGVLLASLWWVARELRSRRDRKKSGEAV